MASYIIDFEIDIITVNLELRLASNDINLKAFEHFLFEIIQTLQENSQALFLFQSIEKYCILQGETSTDLDINMEYNKQAFYNHKNNPKADTID